MQKKIGVLVSGRGEEEAIPLLLRRVLHEYLSEYAIQPGDMLRKAETQLLHRKQDVLERTIQRLARKNDAILIVVDSEDDCPAQLGPEFQARARAAYADERVPIFFVCVYRELETWFIHDAMNLFGVEPLADPYSRRDAKGWIKHSTDLRGYSEVLHSPRLCGQLELLELMERSDSFRVFVDRIERIVAALSPGS